MRNARLEGVREERERERERCAGARAWHGHHSTEIWNLGWPAIDSNCLCLHVNFDLPCDMRCDRLSLSLGGMSHRVGLWDCTKPEMYST